MTISYSLDQISSVAAQVISNSKSKILLFKGDMGAGKTTLITEICKQLGVSEAISSPTYSLVNEYETTEHLIFHFDFYRIKDEEEAYQIGFEEYLDQDAYVFIEWPERILNLLPEHSQEVQISLASDGSRNLMLK